MTEKLPTIQIKGKEYVQVKDRILYLSNEIKDYSIETNYSYYPERKLWVVKAVLTIGKNTFTGLAQEIESDDWKEVNSTSALENAETSAVGRACAMAGIGVIDSIASVDEVNKAQNRSNYSQATRAIKPTVTVGYEPGIIPPEKLKPCDKCGEIFYLRDGKYGKFYSCAGYKTKGCKRTIKLEDAEMWLKPEDDVEQVFSKYGAPLPTSEY